jgi:uncharacterized protein (TIGR04255 family)
MTKMNNPPLIEAICELHWGETHPGQFNFSQEEQSLFPMKFASFANTKGFKIQELVPNGAPPNVPLPSLVSYRYRKSHNTWPCYQTGLGVFTVNQLADGYDWNTFKADISNGIDIFTSSIEDKLSSVIDTGKIQLKYQDAFYLDGEENVEEFLQSTFNIKASLPASFLEKDEIKSNYSAINFTTSIDVTDPKCTIHIIIASVIFGSRPGLLLETIITSNISDLDVDASTIQEKINVWIESAHQLQKHSFSTLIKDQGKHHAS